MLVAGSLRFYKLGDWSFAGDEVATLQETRAFFDPASSPPGSQISRLPRAIPLSYYISRVGYDLFGWNEFGTRAVAAFAGAGLVGVVFLLGEIGLGRRTAFMVAALVAMSPAYIQQAQTNRFYSMTALVAGATILAGSVAVARPGVRWVIATAGGSVVAALTHTVAGVLAPVLCAGLLAARYRKAPRPVALVFGLAALVLGALFIFHVGPLLQRWNEEVPWAYSPVHSILAAVNMLGWPVALLAGLGLALMFEDRTDQRWYWASAVAGWAGTIVALPFVIAYHPWYAFPLALGVLTCAGYAVSDIYGRLRPTRPATSILWLCLVAGLNLPGLASYFTDGSKGDHRAAVAYVNTRWEPNDRVATTSWRAFGYYAPNRTPVFRILRDDNRVETLEQLGPGRLWVIVESGRGGPPVAIREWLTSRASHRFRVSKRRFDYFEYTVDVFLVQPRRTPD
jgi:hypothetical protein